MHVLHENELRVNVILSLCTFDLVDKECREKKVIHPMSSSWMLACCFYILFYLFKCL